MTTKQDLLIEIYGTTVCHWCDKAAILAGQNGYAYVKYNIDENATYKAALMDKLPSARTVPQIFINNNHIGGYQEFSRYVTANKPRVE